MFYEAAQRYELAGRLTSTLDNATATHGGKGLKSYLEKFREALSKKQAKSDQRGNDNNHRQNVKSQGRKTDA